MSLLDGTPAQNHATVAAGFTARVVGVPPGRWDEPAPVAGGVARDVVRHLVTWFPAFLASGAGVRLPAGPAVDADPPGAWRVQVDAVQRLLDEPATASAVFADPHLGQLPLAQAVDRFYTADVFLHTWDLARATGQDETLDEATCRLLLEGMEPHEQMIRASGQYGHRVDVPPDAGWQDRLLGFIGRHP